MQGKYFGFVIGSVVVAWFHLRMRAEAIKRGALFS